MDAPLRVVQDIHGNLRDWNGQPMIMIFDSNPNRSQKSKFARKTELITEAPKFAFINVTKPKEESGQVRKLIRTHVMHDLRRREKSKRKDSKAVCRSLIEQQKYIGDNRTQINPFSPFISQQLATSHAFVDFPVKMQPYMYRLIDQYLSSIMHIMDPTQPANPIESAWYSLVMKDPALFHTILCISAIYIDFLRGAKDSFPAMKHMLEAISLLNARLQQPDSSECVSDATIATIAFIAKAECSLGNYTTWNTHMNGLRRIINIRGGIETLNALLKEKVYSTELMGCIETGSVPRFPLAKEYQLGIIGPLTQPPTLSPGFDCLYQNNLIDRELLVILHDIEVYTQFFWATAGSAIDSEPITVHSRYRLLDWANKKSNERQSSIIQQAICFAAIIFIKCLLPRPPIRGINYTIMLSRLKTSLSKLQTTDSATSALLIWLLFVGGSSINSTVDRNWFIARLSIVSRAMGVNRWDSVKQLLSRFWWVESLNERRYQELWDEVMG